MKERMLINCYEWENNFLVCDNMKKILSVKENFEGVNKKKYGLLSN